MATILIPFSRRTVAATGVFACIFIASPQGAQMLPTNYIQLSALALVYGQLVNNYHSLIHQDTANNAADLDTEIVAAVGLITNLKSTLSTMSATGDQALVLAQMQSVVANALVNVTNAENFE